MENFSSSFYFKVAPKTYLFKNLIYKFHKKIKPGQRVKIPLGRRHVSGFVVESVSFSTKGKADADIAFLKDKAIDKTIKSVLELDENSPALSQKRLFWLQWMSEYYHYPLGLVADLSFLQNKTFKKKKSVKSVGVLSPFFIPEKKSGVELTPEQKLCAEGILKQKGFMVHLIHGVTGSGKTEVYKKLISHVLARGKQVLVLLPEIFLTSQIINRFAKSFPKEIALLHSQVTEGQKTAAWRGLVNGEKKLLVGTRSALFCPLPDLGLIVIDEEHDSNFKQSQKFCYHARDAAIVLAKNLSIPVVLGSATPDFSSYKKALSGVYKLYELQKRAFKQQLPKVTVVDLKSDRGEKKLFWLSPVLFEKIKSTLQRGKQVALFVNRRGQATALVCSGCGQSRKCLNCDISLTLHEEHYLMCHYCSYLEQKPDFCPSCKKSDWWAMGIGTQTVQKVMQSYFPDHVILRADRDSINSRQEMQNFIDIVEKKKAHIIIGTQMISKGLDFPSIYLVGLVLADMDFNLPDFRAGERAFQTLLQMAGRAGRTATGEVVLQTFNPNHSTIFCFKNHDYKSFFASEIKSREKWFYPPFSRLCLFQIESLKQDKGETFAKNLAKLAKTLAADFKDGEIKVLGGGPAPFVKIKNRYRFQILVKGKNHQLLSLFLTGLMKQCKKQSFVQLKLDRDPVLML